eukprot:TRINITY_DN7_c0_g1_i1.p1 TRINITY_DN7_c0_g1~~TRINITY_DN7_c0_g1_i1.p1  ORF type:complete len:364 (-),score=72.33 TRINITY_DN7_c0_g1_i1:263-1309(-)
MKQAAKKIAHIPIVYETTTTAITTSPYFGSSSSSSSNPRETKPSIMSENEQLKELRTQKLPPKLAKKAGEGWITKPSIEDIESVHKLLRKEYGPRVQRSTTDRVILDDVIHTILSQNTTDKNSSAAFRTLKSTFSSWEVARLAPRDNVEAAIKVAGLKTAKAKAIQGLLNQLHSERGDLSLEYLRDLETEEAKRILTSFKGVGPKTAACVLCFGMGRAEFAVDTHVHRVCKDRLQWVNDKFSREETYSWMNSVVPDKDKYSLHYLIIQHGRKVCKAKSPRCGDCILSGKNLCAYDIQNNHENKEIQSDEENSESESEVESDHKKNKGIKRKGKEKVTSNEKTSKKIKN